mmetsp:Transcript_14022/g.21227  ORF Transcript_14022/g.21227 Transcript_14022/m.21227 type:complete len:283 (-) Transcript_14022:115-963(-)
MNRNDLQDIFAPSQGSDPLLSNQELEWHTQNSGGGGGDEGYGKFETQDLGGGPIGGSIGGTIGGNMGGQQTHAPMGGGGIGSSSMGGMGGMGGMSGGMGNTSDGNKHIDFENEPPLLEELGINFDHIGQKTLAVMIPTKVLPQEIMVDTDMAGPLIFCLLLGFCLLLSGKVHFGYIYGFGLIGCMGMYTILNLMSESLSIDIFRTVSILGYCLLPLVVLAATSIFFNLKGYVGFSATVVAILWCTVAATRFIETTLDMRSQRYLVAYPLMLLYSCFALITVF